MDVNQSSEIDFNYNAGCYKSEILIKTDFILLFTFQWNFTVMLKIYSFLNIVLEIHSFE